MRKILLLIVLFSVTITGVRAQVGIGTQDPNPAAQLDITSDPVNPGARGLLIPRVTLTGITMTLTGIAEANMPNSILVFNKGAFTENGKNYSVGYYYWATNDGSEKGAGKWVPILAGESKVVKNFFNTINTNSSTVNYTASDVLSVNVGNGLKETTASGKTIIGLGGDLSEDTEIKLGTHTLKISGLKSTTVLTDEIVVVASDGTLRTVKGVSKEQINPGGATSGQVLSVDSSGKAVWTNITGSSGSSLINGENGITTSGSKVRLGGSLVSPTTITTDGTNTLAIGGLQTSTTGTDALVVADPNTGVLKKIKGVKATQIDGGAGNAGKVLTVNSATGNVEWIELGGANSIDLTNVAGDGLTYSSTTGKLNIEGGNGITIENDKVNWGGELTKTATIVTDDAKAFVIKPKGGTRTTSNVVIEKLPTGTVSDSFVVVDDKGNLKKVDPKSAAKIDYTDGPQETGRRWKVPSTLGGAAVDKAIEEITFLVDFGVGSTKVDVSSKLGNVTVIGIRLIGTDGNPNYINSNATYRYNYNADSTGNKNWIFIGTNQSAFSVTIKGKYFVIVEYFKN